MNLKKTRLLA